MEEDLDKALSVLFGKTTKYITPKQDTEEISTKSLIEQARTYYDYILDSMSKNNWIAFGENFDKLGKVLEDLDK